MNHVTHPLSSAGISTFYQKSANFAILENKYIDQILVNNFWNILTSYEPFNIFLINMVTTLMMSAKLGTPGLVEINIFSNNVYDLIIVGCDVTNKFLWRDSNCIINVVMWPKFGISSISMRKVTVTLIL